MNNFFVTHKNPVAVVLVLLLAGGFFSYSGMQTSLFPEVTFPKIKIIADNGLQPVNKMMITVTKPLENAVKRVQNLKLVRSITSRGSCEISAFMSWDSDIDLSKQQIESAINQVENDLPKGINITVEKMNPSILQVMGYVIEGKGKSNMELNLIANYTVRPFLSQVEGVADVPTIGGKTKEYRMELNAQKMSSLGVTPSMISKALSQTNFINSNGYLTDYHRLYLTVTDANVDNLDELQNLIISNDGKRILQLKDIADVKVAEQTDYIKVNANGKNAVLIAVMKQANANLINVSREVEHKVEELNKTILPKGVSLTPYYIQADFVSDSIRSVNDSLWIGILLAIVVAVLFLRSVKASAVILVTIPVTLSLTLIIMHAMGYTFNIMTFGAIAASIGLIIDDAIVVVEQIHRTHEEHPEMRTRELLGKSVSYLFPAMIGSSISTIVIFFPFALLSGVAGAYFKILANTMIITLCCSFFVTWIGLPVVYLLFSGKKNYLERHGKEAPQERRKWISFFIYRPVLSFIFILLLLASIVFIPSHLETGFLPEMDEGSIVFDYKSPPGTSLEETDRILLQVEKIITAVPEVESYSRRTGTQMGFFITEPNYGDYLIQLKKNRSRTTEEVIDDVRKKVETTQPALTADFGQVIGDMLGDLISSTKPIEVKIFGDNQNILHKLSRQVSQVITKIKGTADVFDGITVAGPSLNIEPDNRKLAQFNMTPADFQDQLQTQLAGSVIGHIYEKEQQTAVRMIYPASTKTTIDQIQQGTVFMANGKLKLISGLANISIDSGTAEIERENLQSMLAVTARLNNRDLGSVMNDIRHEITSQVHLPQGYHIEYAGAFKEQQQSFSELLLILLSAVLFVFATIIFLFKEIKVAVLILIIAVLGVSGGLIALLITHTTLNVGSYTGIIMIIGIIGENAIFTFLQFERTLKTSNTNDAIVHAVATRLRPNLMTACGAIVALLPLALGIGTGAQLHQPLAIAVIGGFIIAMPLLLVVYPALLRLLYKSEKATAHLLKHHHGEEDRFH